MWRYLARYLHMLKSNGCSQSRERCCSHCCILLQGGLLLHYGTACAGLELLEEVVAFVVDEDEGWEVFYLYLPYGFHAYLGELDAFD